MGFKGNIYKPVKLEQKYDYCKYSNNATYIASKWCKPEIEMLANEFNNSLKRQITDLIREYLIINYYKESLRFQNTKKHLFIKIFN